MPHGTRWSARIGAALLGLALVFGTLVALSERLPPVEATAFSLAPLPPFRTWEEHNAIYKATEFPYILKLETKHGALLYAGVQHSSNSEDAQFEVIRRAWDAFQPTVALNEGRSRYPPVAARFLGGFNDPMLVYLLAKRDNTPIFSIEPTYEVEVAALLEEWPAELVAAYFAFRVILSEAGGNPERAESAAPGLIANRTDVEGLRGAIASVQDLDRIWRMYGNGQPDWRTASHIDEVEWLKPIGDDSREARGKHMIRALATLLMRRERVFAVVGASHVIRQEPTLRSLIESELKVNATPGR